MKELESFPPKLSDLVQDYLDGKQEVSEFYQHTPNFKTLEECHDQIRDRVVDRETLVEVLLSQSRSSSYSTALTIEQIKCLSKPEVSTITTGHQLCLYGGPMFFLYKILSIISLCNGLQANGKKSVPIFWMASEDHDFGEINHVYLNGKRIEWSKSQAGPVGRMHLKGMANFKKELSDVLQSDYRHKEQLDELDSIFGENKTLAEAIKDFVYWIFADQGVVVIDADDKALKSLFTPLVLNELDSGFSQKVVESTSRQLSSLGYNTQVNGREINLFWMQDGYRERIVKAEKGFETADGRFLWSKDEMFSLIKTNPECFSPNVILRPLYQEAILPNIAYVGGPGETSYWLQLKGVFDAANIPMPMVLLRDMFALVSPLETKKKNQLEIHWKDLYTDQDALIKRLIRAGGSHEEIVNSRQTLLQSSFLEMTHELAHFDESLRQSAEAEMVRLSNKLEALKKKILRSEKLKNEVLVRRIDHLRTVLFPNGNPQERHSNWLGRFASPQEVLELLVFCDPIKARIKIAEQG